MSIGFKNKDGKLKILKRILGGWIDYVKEVGGKYKIGVPEKMVWPKLKQVRMIQQRLTLREKKQKSIQTMNFKI